MRSFRTLFATCAALAPAVAHGQAVNYAALQETVGEPVTASVSGKPQRASEAPASVTIITRDQIRRSPARDVPDLLKIFAGVDVNRWTAGQSDVAVRGGVQTYNARLLVLVNGRQVYLDHYGMADWNLLGVQLANIQQIELVRGPASALFGFNAASGVVNIITLDPLNARSATVTGELGTHGIASISGSAALPIGDKLGVNLSAGHQREDERHIPDAVYHPTDLPAVQNDQASATLVATPDSSDRIELNGGWSRNQQLEYLPSQLLTVDRFRSETAGLLVNHDTGWGSVTGRAYANWLNADYGVTGASGGAFSAIGFAQMRNRIVVAQLSTLVRLGEDNTLRLGGEYRNNQLFSADAYSPRIGYQVGAADAMLELHPSSGVAVTLAGRLDRLWLSQGGTPQQPVATDPALYDRAFTSVSFNAAVVAQVGQAGQLRLNGGRGIQSPSLTDFGFRVRIPIDELPFPVYVTGDPQIHPVTVWSGELGYSQRIGETLHLGATAFFTRTEHVIASPGSVPLFQIITVPSPVVIAPFANAGSFDTYGVELTAGGRLTRRLGWHASYTWTAVNQDVLPDEQPGSFALSPRDTTPRHLAALSLDWATGPWSVAAQGRFTSATRQYSFTSAGDLALFAVRRAVDLDAKVSRRLTPHLLGYVAGENLGAASGAYGSPVPADRRVRVGASLDL